MKFLIALKNFWIKIGEILGNIIGPILLGIIYLIIIGPIWLISKIARKDFLAERMKSDSYWNNAHKENIDTLEELQLPF